jgi:tetratricopeptide (TPR) repeat protein
VIRHRKLIMKLNKQLTLLLLILISSISNIDLFSQNAPSKPSRQSSLEAYSKGSFEQAYKEFRELLLTYSKDPLYKYYAGVCLVKLNKDPREAESLLKQAIQNASVVKSLPSDALFYLGRAQQMGGKFPEAIESYNLCLDQAGKKVARELNIQSFIQECIDKRGKIAEPEIKPAEIIKKEKEEPVPQVPVTVVKETAVKETAVKETALKETAVKETIVKPLDKLSLVKSDLPEATDKILNDALELQIKADSLTALVAEQKKKLENAGSTDKNALKARISEMELAADAFQKAADQKYNEARETKNPPPENKVVKEVVAKPDTLSKGESIIDKPIEVFSIFEIQPKPVPDPAEKIKVDPEIPEGLIYRIQIAVFRNPVTPAYFKGISPVYGFKVAGSDKTSYCAGMFRKAADASKALAKVKARGFRDAFVVSLNGGKTVSPDRATVLEKDWGNKPFFNIATSGKRSQTDTIAPTLAYRVEVIRSTRPARYEIIEEYRKMAGTRGLDIQMVDNGAIAYLIGKFITFETAEEYANLLVKNGYRDAKVVAWLGKKEIPVDTARQLFDKVK